jgi:hypothetical protein
MKLMRCSNPSCNGGDFEAELPICPACKLDGRNPRYRNFVTELVTVHFLPPDPIVKTMVLGTLACDPSKPHQPGIVATPSHAAVNCKCCIASQAFKDTCGDALTRKHPPADGEQNAYIQPPAGVKKNAAAAPS